MNSRLTVLLALLASSFLFAKGALAAASPAYDQLMIDTVEIAYDESSPYQGLKPAQLARFQAAVVEAIATAVGKRFTVVTAPGPGVLRVHAAITDVVAEEKAKKFWSYTPVGLVKGRVDTAAGKDFVLRSAVVEVQLLDALSGEPLIGVAEPAADGAGDADRADLSLRRLVTKIGALVSELTAPAVSP